MRLVQRMNNFNRGLSFYLKVLSILYFTGALLHFMDVLDLRLKYSEMTDIWKMWTLFLLFADLAAAVGLWKNTIWGIGFFLLVAGSQIITYTAFQSIFAKQPLLVWFHIFTLGLYFYLRVKSKRLTHSNKF